LKASKHRASSQHHNPPQLDQRRLEREHERLVRENENLRRQLIERDKKLAEAEKQIAEAEKQIAEGEKEIADLERQLGLRRQNSTTSSKPPSSDGLAGEQRQRGSKRKKGRRKPGGQPGHTGHCRELVPAERVNEVIEVFPPRCRHCNHRFSGRGPKPAIEGEPRRHQVTELPPIEAHITEYQWQRALGPECGKATQASLPEEAAGNFGPQLTALIAYGPRAQRNRDLIRG
jgi:hypothetical protein